MHPGFIKLIDHMGTDRTVVNSARISFDKKVHDEWTLTAKDHKLIYYLAKHNHWTPFAHPQITLHIKAPIPIRTQFFKHKVGFVENEISRRYVFDIPEFFEPDWSYRPEGSLKQGAGDHVDPKTKEAAHKIYSECTIAAQKAYNDLLEYGIAPEQARFVLPQGAFTEWYWTGSLAAFARFYNQRSETHAQAEIREYAQEIRDIIAPLFPISWTALTNLD